MSRSTKKITGAADLLTPLALPGKGVPIIQITGDELVTGENIPI